MNTKPATIGARDADLLRPERTNAGLYAQDRLVLGRNVFLTVGGRVEHNDNFGWKAVPRAAVAVRLGQGQATTLKASAGAGIKEPDFFQSFGVSFYAQGNPDLKPERSLTFDGGIEQRFLGGRLRAEATYFHHDYKDQIAYTVTDFTTFEGTYFNLGKTRAQGLELAVEGAPVPGLSFTAAYTLTDGEVLVSSSDFDPVYAVGQSLLRRPKHQGSVSARVGRGRVSGAVTVLAVGRRADSDFVGLGLLIEPRLHQGGRAPAGTAQGRRRGVSRGREPFRRGVPGGPGFPRSRPIGARRAAPAPLRRQPSVSTRERVLLAWSSGKDSAFALHTLRGTEGVEVVGLLTTVNDAFDRVAMHAVRCRLLEAQAEAVGLPFRLARIPWPCPNDAYERVMADALAGGAGRGRHGGGLRRSLPGGHQALSRRADGGHGPAPPLPALGPADPCAGRGDDRFGPEGHSHLRRSSGPARVLRGPRLRPGAASRPAARGSTPAARTASSTPSPGTGPAFATR